jgi:hypothetical protein
MLSGNELEELVFQLFMDLEANVIVNGEQLRITLSKDMKELKLSTIVFHGDDFVPLSVRKAIKAKSIFNISLITTQLAIDESNHDVRLEFTQNLDESGFEGFEEWLEDYFWIASEWRYILEKHGREDLVFVYVNRR